MNKDRESRKADLKTSKSYETNETAADRLCTSCTADGLLYEIPKT